MSARKNIFPSLILSTAMILATPKLQAGGFTIIELGADKTGMMCSIAKPDDLSGVYHNPATIASLRGTRFHASTGLSFLDISVRLKAWPAGEGKYGSEDFIDTPVDDDGYFEGTYKPTKYFGAMPMFATSTDFGFDEGPVVALSVYVPDFIGAFMPQDAPTRYFATEAYFIAGMASLSAGYRLPGWADWLSVGASIGVMYIRMEGSRWQNVHLYGDETSDYVLRLLGEDYKPFWNIGLAAEPIEGLNFGFVFLGPVDADLEGTLKFSLPEGVTEEDPVLLALTGGQGLVGDYHQTTKMKVPAGLGLGVRWTIIRQLDVAADFRWWFYNTFKNQYMYHDIDLSIGGQPAVENPLVTPKNYKESWTVSLGTLVRPVPDSIPLELMAGWTYDTSPSPKNTRSLDSPTADITGFSMGARYIFDEHWTASITYYHYWYLQDEITDSILEPPQNAKFGGTVDTFSLQLNVKL